MRALGLKGQKAVAALPTEKIPDVAELPGLGTRIVDENGSVWSLGKCGWNGTAEVAAPGSGDSIQATRPGCELRQDGNTIRHFQFQEALRPETAETLSQLESFNPHILSGDHDQRVTQIAESVGISRDRVHAGLNPEQKADLVKKIDPEHSLFLGDGANDSLAFDAANMSGAVAGRGLLESKADFYFLSSGLHFLPRIFQLASSHARAVRTVFTFSLSYNLIAVGVCLAGLMNPLLAAILMPLSSIISLALVGYTIPIKRR
ncbi:MAG: HAD-IC family P-type ATPase [Akkermansiaceae bacterium]|nr:HAD-IC family P-type ATPase [Akkermansiaceae bacterium]